MSNYISQCDGSDRVRGLGFDPRPNQTKFLGDYRCVLTGNKCAQNWCVISSPKSSNIYTGPWWAFTPISRASGQRELLEPQVVVPVIWWCEHKRSDSRMHRNAWDNLVWQTDNPNGNPTKLQALYWVKRQKGYVKTNSDETYGLHGWNTQRI